MKALILTTAIAISFAAPSFASDQLARSLGVEPGQFTTAQLFALDRAHEDDDYNAARHILQGGGNIRGVSAAGAQFAAQHAEEDDDGSVGRFVQGRGGREIVSTQSFGDTVTEAGRAFAIEQARENDDWPLVRLLERGGSLGGTQSLF